MPDVSILMAVYNAAPYLREALDSLLAQTHDGWEALCVDDASTDDSLAVLQEYAARDARIRVYHQTENQGQAVARNVALAHARGAYIMMLDADDYLSADALRQAVATFERHERTDCVVFQLRLFGAKDELWPVCPQLQTGFITGEDAFRLSLDWTLHGLALVRADLHRRYPYDTSYRLYADDNTCRLHYLHAREVWQTAGIYFWRQHAASTTHTINTNYFLHIRANQSLLRQMKAEGVAPVVIAFYERYRRRVFTGQYYTYIYNKEKFNVHERAHLEAEFRDVYATLLTHVPYPLWVAATRLRIVLGRIKRLLLGRKTLSYMG